ncbi:UNVERIFIED_CONTAM: hypothetical protein HDU68_003920, partial [Siphonaria sp. JEL0065]
ATSKKKDSYATASNSASKDGVKKRGPTYKPKVSISFKNIAAGITRENYTPQLVANMQHQHPQQRGVVAAVQDPELIDSNGQKSREDKAKLLMRLNLNRKLKQKILEKKGMDASVCGDTGVMGEMYHVDPQRQYQPCQNNLCNQKTPQNNSAMSELVVETAGPVESELLKRDVKLQYIPSRTKPKKNKMVCLSFVSTKYH